MSSLIPDNVSKHTNVYDVLVERGLVAQCTNPEKFRELLGNEKIKFYIGFDPTADCLHIGHFIPMITMMYILRYSCWAAVQARSAIRQARLTCVR